MEVVVENGIPVENLNSFLLKAESKVVAVSYFVELHENARRVRAPPV